MQPLDARGLDPEIANPELLPERGEGGGRVVHVDRAVSLVRCAPDVVCAGERDRPVLVRQLLTVARRRKRRAALEQRDVGLAVGGGYIYWTVDGAIGSECFCLLG